MTQDQGTSTDYFTTSGGFTSSSIIDSGSTMSSDAGMDVVTFGDGVQFYVKRDGKFYPVDNQ